MYNEADYYDYRVRWSAEDGTFLATVAEFPSLNVLVARDKDQFDALDEIVCLVMDTIQDLKDRGEPVPATTCWRVQ